MANTPALPPAGKKRGGQKKPRFFLAGLDPPGSKILAWIVPHLTDNLIDLHRELASIVRTAPVGGRATRRGRPSSTASVQDEPADMTTMGRLVPALETGWQARHHPWLCGKCICRAVPFVQRPTPWCIPSDQPGAFGRASSAKWPTRRPLVSVAGLRIIAVHESHDPGRREASVQYGAAFDLPEMSLTIRAGVARRVLHVSSGSKMWFGQHCIGGSEEPEVVLQSRCNG